MAWSSSSQKRTSGNAGTDGQFRPSQMNCPEAGSVTERLDDSTRSWFNKRNTETLKGALAFVPWVLQQAYFEGGLDEGQIVIHKGKGAVVFSDASGFTDLTAQLALKNNGAEQLSQTLKSFFTPLIDLINAYRGDVIKFTRNALTIYFQAVDDTVSPKYNGVVPPHGTYGLPDLGPMITAVLRASACCIEIHKRLHNFETGVDGVCLSLHIGVGCGEVRILQVGGETPPDTPVARCEYIIAGPPLEQISVAEPLAKTGETCLSPQAWDFISDCVIEGPPIDENPDYHLLLRMDESKYTFPTIKHAAIENDNRLEKRFRLPELQVIRRYIPSAVFKQIECGTLTYVNEMRNISTIFVNGTGPNLDVMSNKGATLAQDLMSSVQRCCHQHEGTLNKFVINSKGMLFLLVFGLPPLVHQDDPTRAVLACFDMVKVFTKLDVVGRFGVTTGQSYCGVVGSSARMEYTVLGDCVNLASKLMASANPHSIRADVATKNRCTPEVIFNALTPFRVKNKDEMVLVFEPVKKDTILNVGLTPARTICFPWHDHPFGGGQVVGKGMSAPTSTNMRQLCSVRSWEGILLVNEMLGSPFNKALHEQAPLVEVDKPASAKAPAGSPFTEGGVLIIESHDGMGRVDLAEHIVVFTSVNLKVLPVFGSMGPRPGDSVRLAVELIKSCLQVYRAVTPGSIPDDDFQALEQLVPDQNVYLPILRQVLKESSYKTTRANTLDAALEVVISLLRTLVKTTPILLTMQFEYGTSLFPKNLEDGPIFWKAVTRLCDLVIGELQQNKSGNNKPLVMMIICRDADDDNVAVQFARSKVPSTFMHLNSLTEENILEYMSNYMNVPEQMVPQALRQFVSKVTSGNPLFIRETINKLQENHISVQLGANNMPKQIDVKGMDDVAIATWQETAMVGGTVCLLESLDPLEAAVLKMSTCFQRTFTLPDLAASTCSRWADATRFDFLRLFKAIRKLVQSNIIEAEFTEEEKVAPAPRDPNAVVARTSSGSGANQPSIKMRKIQCFHTRNMLIRAVGGAMVLEAQKKTVKRQALIDRALGRKLSDRMAILAAKKNNTHIPWYYEQAFRMM